jgi:hypothetical protein
MIHEILPLARQNLSKLREPTVGITPRIVKFYCRGAAIVAAVGEFGLTWVPKDGVGALSATLALVLQVIWGYGLTLLVFGGFSRRRRCDLSLASALIVIVAAVTARLAGASLGPAYGLGGLAGVLGSYLPGQIERLRLLERTQGFKTFADISASDRRRNGRVSRQHGALPIFPVPEDRLARALPHQSRLLKP